MNALQSLEKLFEVSFKSKTFKGTTFVRAGQLANCLFNDSMRAEGVIYLFAHQYVDITGKHLPLKILLQDQLVRGPEEVLRLRIASWKAGVLLQEDISQKQLSWQMWVPAFWAVKVSKTLMPLLDEIGMAFHAMSETGTGLVRINGQARIQFALLRQSERRDFRPAIQVTTMGQRLVIFDTRKITAVQCLDKPASGFEKLLPDAVATGNILPLYIKRIA